MKWACGMTTVWQRRNDLLPQTLASIKAAGFPEPRLFVDGFGAQPSHAKLSEVAAWYEGKFPSPELTIRQPALRTFGNWLLALWEMYVRAPGSERWVIFQDDVAVCSNLRAYMDHCDLPERGYWNLYTAPSSEIVVPRDINGQKRMGWYQSAMLSGVASDGRGEQLGRGALALVFGLEAVTTLLSSYQHIVERPQDCDKGLRNVDGAVVQAMNKAGWREWVHWPSLVQHVGLVSSMGTNPQKQSESFPGEEFDALKLVDGRGWGDTLGST